ncbi:TetR/AcrR family transcriptional regulator [Niveispirillum sp. KHB5.9]
MQRDPGLPRTRKGLETRERLIDAATSMVNRLGYQDLRLADIAAEADVPSSLIYRYFKGKPQIVLAALTRLRDEVQDVLAADSAGAAFDRILDKNRRIIDLYARNPGLLRCIIAFGGDEPEFQQLFREMSQRWNQAVARSIARQFPDLTLGEGERLMLAHALCSMVDNFVYECLVLRSPLLAPVFAEDRDDMALFVSLLWHRALYLCDPPTDRLGRFAGLTGFHL